MYVDIFVLSCGEIISFFFDLGITFHMIFVCNFFQWQWKYDILNGPTFAYLGCDMVKENVL